MQVPEFRVSMATGFLTPATEFPHAPPFAVWQVPEFRVSMAIGTDVLDALYRKLKPKGVTMTALLAKVGWQGCDCDMCC